MGDTFSADTDQLRERAQQFELIAADVAKTVRTLRTTLDGEGEPWGKDDAGRAFANSYAPEHKQAISDLNSLVEALRQAGPDLHNLAENFENQDHAAGQGVRDTRTPIRNDSASTPSGLGTSPPDEHKSTATSTPVSPPYARSAPPTTAAAGAPRTATGASTTSPPDSPRSLIGTPRPAPTGSAPGRGTDGTEHTAPGRDGRALEQPDTHRRDAHSIYPAGTEPTRTAQTSRPSSPWTKPTAVAKHDSATAQGGTTPKTPWTRPVAGRPKVSASDSGTLAAHADTAPLTT